MVSWHGVHGIVATVMEFVDGRTALASRSVCRLWYVVFDQIESLYGRVFVACVPYAAVQRRLLGAYLPELVHRRPIRRCDLFPPTGTGIAQLRIDIIVVTQLWYLLGWVRDVPLAATLEQVLQLVADNFPAARQLFDVDLTAAFPAEVTWTIRGRHWTFTESLAEALGFGNAASRLKFARGEAVLVGGSVRFMVQGLAPECPECLEPITFVS